MEMLWRLKQSQAIEQKAQKHYISLLMNLKNCSIHVCFSSLFHLSLLCDTLCFHVILPPSLCFKHSSLYCTFTWPCVCLLPFILLRLMQYTVYFSFIPLPPPPSWNQFLPFCSLLSVLLWLNHPISPIVYLLLTSLPFFIPSYCILLFSVRVFHLPFLPLPHITFSFAVFFMWPPWHHPCLLPPYICHLSFSYVSFYVCFSLLLSFTLGSKRSLDFGHLRNQSNPQGPYSSISLHLAFHHTVKSSSTDGVHPVVSLKFYLIWFFSTISPTWTRSPQMLRKILFFLLFIIFLILQGKTVDRKM